MLQASHDDLGSAEKIVTLTGKEDIGDITLSTEKPSAPIADAKDVSSGDPRASAQPDRISVTVPQTMEAMGSPSKDFILNELNFEIKKLSAEFKHLSQEIDDLKALSKMWVNPLTIYSKEIILKNGSTVFGKIIYQDDKSLKVETLVGYLIVDRAQVVRIVDNVITEDTQEYVPNRYGKAILHRQCQNWHNLDIHLQITPLEMPVPNFLLIVYWLVIYQKRKMDKGT